MKKFISKFIAIILLILPGCGMKPSNSNDNSQENCYRLLLAAAYVFRPSGGATVFPEPTGSLTTRGEVLALATGSTYYLDASVPAGGDGSESAPWNTLSDALAGIKSGDCVIVANGNYGTWTSGTAYASWTVFINKEGHHPVISNMNILQSALTNMNLVFYGFRFYPDYVDPGPTDPHDPNSGLDAGHSYKTAPYDVYLNNVGNMQFINCEATCYNKYLCNEGFYIVNSSNIQIERCHIHNVSRGITYIKNDNLKILYSYIHNTLASFIMDGNNGSNPNSNVLIEGNHCRDMNWAFADAYCNRAANTTPHGSCIALGPSTVNVVVRNNILHDGGPNTGIGMYSGGVYHNLLIENNVIYDIHSSEAMKLGSVGQNIVVRNNIVSARGKYNSVDQYKYFIALNHYGDYTGYSRGLHLYNNIFIGGVCLTNANGVNGIYEGNNIYWCVSPSGVFNPMYRESDLTNSRIKLGIDDAYFDSKIFTDTFIRSWLYWDVATDVWHQYTLSSPGHQKIMDLHSKPGTEPINFGDPDHQPSDSLGTLDSNGHFIIPDGRARDGSHHDAGAYQL